jgi:hypothetical protein
VSAMGSFPSSFFFFFFPNPSIDGLYPDPVQKVKRPG